MEITLSTIKADTGGFVGPSFGRWVDARLPFRAADADERRGRHALPLRRAPRIVALGFQIKEGRLHGPRDLLADRGFDRTRQLALEAADYLRRMGPFEPHRAGLDELEYTMMPELMKRLQPRWRSEAERRTEVD